MSEAEAENGEAQLDEFNYGVLMNVARSASKQFGEVDIDTHAPKKGELVEDMVDADIEHDDGWVREGEEIDLLPVQTPDGDGNDEPQDKTVFYCLTRAETTAERVEEIGEALDEIGYELRETAGGDKYSIVLPAPQTELDEFEDDEESEEAEESDESDPEVDEEEADQDEGDEEETDESEAEEAESEEEQEDADEDEVDEETIDGVPRSVIRERLKERNKTSEGPKGQPPLYETAKKLNIDGRSDMTKYELIEAILEARERRQVA